MSQPSAKEKWLARFDNALRDGTFVKLTLSGYRGSDEGLRRTGFQPVSPDSTGSRGSDEGLRHVFGRRIELRGQPHLSFVYRYATRDVTKNFPLDEARALLAELAGAQFRHAHLFSTQWTLELDGREGRSPRLIESKPIRDTLPSTSHDQARPRPVSANTRWLHALGVTTAEGTVARGMEAKFRQINKFVEILEPSLPTMRDSRRDETNAQSPHGPSLDTPVAPFKVLDMGCGKGYLTFAAYDWLRRSGWSGATVRGIEARSELVDLCNRVARENNLAGLTFDSGQIATANLDHVDVLIALHACDTATDDAIAKGIAAGASLIIVSPCCHKELRPQLTPPPVLAGALRHGILRERHAEFVTDALRAALLEWAGYETKVFEFISTEHTAKNLMIAATKRPSASNRDEAATRVRELAAFYGIHSQQLAASLNFTLG